MLSSAPRPALAAFVALTVSSSSAYACKCGLDTAAKKDAVADVVFHGTVVATEEGPESTRLMRVEVDKRIKGKVPGTVIVSTPHSRMACGVVLAPGTKFRFRAYRDGDRFGTRRCRYAVRGAD